jgi:tetrahydromethanopterin S-methyltransferase subunit F
MLLSDRLRGLATVILFSALLISLALGQTRDVERRLGNLEAANAGTRIAVIESTISEIKRSVEDLREESRTASRVTMALIGALGLERGVSALAARRRRREFGMSEESTE